MSIYKLTYEKIDEKYYLKTENNDPIFIRDNILIFHVNFIRGVARVPIQEKCEILFDRDYCGEINI